MVLEKNLGQREIKANKDLSYDIFKVMVGGVLKEYRGTNILVVARLLCLVDLSSQDSNSEVLVNLDLPLERHVSSCWL